MTTTDREVRCANPGEFPAIGQLMVAVYSRLDGFPDPTEQPEYYRMLANVGGLTTRPQTELLVAVSPEGDLFGAVVFFGDMAHYGSGGTATHETDAAGFRLLAVRPSARGRGVGKHLTLACIDRARRLGRSQVVIHTTGAMQTAWGMYERMGFRRSEDLDFMQEDLPVFGFRLRLDQLRPDGSADP